MLIESTVATEARNTFIIYINTRYVAFKCVFICYFTPKQCLISAKAACSLSVSGNKCREDILDAGFLPLTVSHYFP